METVKYLFNDTINHSSIQFKKSCDVSVSFFLLWSRSWMDEMFLLSVQREDRLLCWAIRRCCFVVKYAKWKEMNGHRHSHDHTESHYYLPLRSQSRVICKSWRYFISYSLFLLEKKKWIVAVVTWLWLWLACLASFFFFFPFLRTVLCSGHDLVVGIQGMAWQGY